MTLTPEKQERLRAFSAKLRAARARAESGSLPSALANDLNNLYHADLRQIGYSLCLFAMALHPPRTTRGFHKVPSGWVYDPNFVAVRVQSMAENVTLTLRGRPEEFMREYHDVLPLKSARGALIHAAISERPGN